MSPTIYVHVYLSRTCSPLSVYPPFSRRRCKNDISCLGWFISITDPREGGEASCLSDHFGRLVHYTRLCYTLSVRVYRAPKKTHLLLSAGYAPITMLDATLSEVSSLSSSLPGSSRRGGEKKVARRHRAESGPANGHIQHSDMCFAMIEKDDRKLGHCAETLNILRRVF